MPSEMLQHPPMGTFQVHNGNPCLTLIHSKGNHLGSIHLSAEISFRAESFGTVPKFQAEVSAPCRMNRLEKLFRQTDV